MKDSETDASTVTHVVVRPIAGMTVKPGELIDCSAWKPGIAEHYVGERRLRALPPASLAEEARRDEVRARRAHLAIDRQETEAKAEFATAEQRVAEIRRRFLELDRFIAESRALETEQEQLLLRIGRLRDLIEQRLPLQRARLVPFEERAAATARAAAAMVSKAS